jgi:hypothetical protein
MEPQSDMLTTGSCGRAKQQNALLRRSLTQRVVPTLGVLEATARVLAKNLHH